MSVRVRLTRVGSRKNPVWRVVVADQRSPRDGRVIETVGRYDPQRRPSEIILDRDRLAHWIERGASPTRTVRRLMQADDRETPPASATTQNGRASTARGAGAAPAEPEPTEPEASAPDAQEASDADVSAPEAGSDEATADAENKDASDAAAEEGTPVPPDEPSDEEGPGAEVPAEEAPDGATPVDDAPESSD